MNLRLPLLINCTIASPGQALPPIDHVLSEVSSSKVQSVLYSKFYNDEPQHAPM